MNKLKKFYKDKKVLVTGHTGFKGSWLSIWLLEMGAKVIGYSNGIPTKPSNFEACRLKRRVRHIEADIRDIEKLKNTFKRFSPEVVFHLAAQPIVRLSYEKPQETFSTNIIGTVNLLECLREFDSIKTAVIITSDKCYKNKDWWWGYREDDQVGGDDPYSASKGAAELVFHSYYKSFFNSDKRVCKVASARAGNVIGGGDWAMDRIIPDCVKAFSKNKTLIVRNHKATRPWQHVLESLSGYLWLASQLERDKTINGEAFNFGPDQKVSESVKDLIKIFRKHFGSGAYRYKKDERGIRESLWLKLSCDKALKLLEWHSVLSFEKTVEMTADWYKHFYGEKKDMFEFSTGQIRQYVADAKKWGLEWARGYL